MWWFVEQDYVTISAFNHFQSFNLKASSKFKNMISTLLFTISIPNLMKATSEGEISSERYCYQWGVPKKRNIILLTIWCILRWYIVTFDKTKQLWAYPMSKTNLHHFLFMSVTLTFWVLRPFWALKSDLASVIASQLQHFVCQTFWYIKIRNPSTNKKVIPQNVKWYRFPKGLLC